MPRVQCRLEFTYSSREVAERVLGAVELDNLPFVEARVEGKTLISETSADSLDSLIHTLEDYLSCISVAEKMLKGL